MTEKDKATADIFKTVRDNYPNNILFVMPEQFTKKLRSFMLIREDLIFISQIAEQLISLKESPNSNNLTEFALWQSIIITYGKCFTENKAGMSRLDRSILDNHDKKYQDLHDRVMELRNKYIAHRDDTVNEQTIVFIKVSKSGNMLDKDTEDIIISRKLASWRVRDIKSLLELLELLREETSDRIQKHADKAHNAFLQKYTPEQAKSFLVSNMKFN